MERTERIINKEKPRPKGKTKQRIRYKFEWEEAVDHVAKFYDLTWEEVTKWNIIKFYHRCEYANFKIKKDQEQTKQSKYKSRR